jgi:DedD protein
MSDQTFREIQLSSKQLVFLFMASLVFAVAIFLLGVSVGRGVKSATLAGAPASGEVAAAAESAGPVTLPPPTQTTAADMTYHSELQGSGTKPGVTPKDVETPVAVTAKAPAAVDVPAASDISVEVTKAQPATKAQARVNGDAPTAEKAALPKAKAAATWSVQVGAFSSRDNANKLVNRLKGKGYAVTATTAGRLFLVRVGPFSDRAEADRTATRLRREDGVSKPAVVH